MCGRVRLSNDYSEIKIRLRFDATAPAPNLPPSWNIPSTEKMLVATYTADGRRISEVMRWGLVPWWAKDIEVGYSTFNARADSVSTKPAFRDAWKRGQRCLVVTNGFYEWRKRDRQAFAVGMADDDLMVMAGLWDEWKSPKGERIKSCTVITTEPNNVIGALHVRMPVILAVGLAQREDERVPAGSELETWVTTAIDRGEHRADDVAAQQDVCAARGAPHERTAKKSLVSDRNQEIAVQRTVCCTSITGTSEAANPVLTCSDTSRPFRR